MDRRTQEHTKNAEAAQKCKKLYQKCKSCVKNAEAVQECRIPLRMQRLCSNSPKNGGLHSQNVPDYSIPFHRTFQNIHFVLFHSTEYSKRILYHNSIPKNIPEGFIIFHCILQNILEGLFCSIPFYGIFQKVHSILWTMEEVFHYKRLCKAMIMLCLPSKVLSNLSILEIPKKWKEC